MSSNPTPIPVPEPQPETTKNENPAPKWTREKDNSRFVIRLSGHVPS